MIQNWRWQLPFGERSLPQAMPDTAVTFVRLSGATSAEDWIAANSTPVTEYKITASRFEEVYDWFNDVYRFERGYEYQIPSYTNGNEQARYDPEILVKTWYSNQYRDFDIARIMASWGPIYDLGSNESWQVASVAYLGEGGGDVLKIQDPNEPDPSQIQHQTVSVGEGPASPPLNWTPPEPVLVDGSPEFALNTLSSANEVPFGPFHVPLGTAFIGGATSNLGKTVIVDPETGVEHGAFNGRRSRGDMTISWRTDWPLVLDEDARKFWIRSASLVKKTTFRRQGENPTESTESIPLTSIVGEDFAGEAILTHANAGSPDVDCEKSVAYYLRLLPVELYSDLNNDGQANSGDAGLVGKPYASGASDDEKDKGTEFIFANDSLSNGAWDKDDGDTPGKPSDPDDDDAEPIIVGIGSLPNQTEVWLEHPASAGLKFYSDKKCTQEIHLSSSQHHIVGGSASWPTDNKVYVRAESVSFSSTTNPQVEGDLKLMIKPAGGAAAGIEAAKMKVTFIKDFGAKKFFAGSRDYIMENNTLLFVDDKDYGGGKKIRFAIMREEACRMRAIEAYWRTPKLWQIDGVTGLSPSATVAINGNMTFDIRSIGIIHELTARCHGRLVTGGVKNTDVSSDNDDPNNPAPGDPLRGSVLAGDSGKYVAMKADFDFTIAKGRVPDNPIPQEALGGWHTDYANVNQNQMVGIGKVSETNRVVFTATMTAGSGFLQQVATDAKNSGVPSLPGGDADDLMFVVGDGGTSRALAYKTEASQWYVAVRGMKHQTIAGSAGYCINTYLIFQATKPR